VGPMPIRTQLLKKWVGPDREKHMGSTPLYINFDCDSAAICWLQEVRFLRATSRPSTASCCGRPGHTRQPRTSPSGSYCRRDVATVSRPGSTTTCTTSMHWRRAVARSGLASEAPVAAWSSCPTETTSGLPPTVPAITASSARIATYTCERNTILRCWWWTVREKIPVN